jgi:hypothetical protein
MSQLPPAKRSLADVGANVQFAKAVDLKGIPFMVESAVLRFDQGNPQRKIREHWVYDFTIRLLATKARGENFVLSMAVHDTRGSLVRSRRRIFEALNDGAVGPITTSKGDAQNDFVQLVDYEGPEDFDKLVKGLEIVSGGTRVEKKTPNIGAMEQVRREAARQNRARGGGSRARQSSEDFDDFPGALEENDDDLPF